MARLVGLVMRGRIGIAVGGSVFVVGFAGLRLIGFGLVSGWFADGLEKREACWD